ncbi:MAG TPA: 3-keto-5-aminohexanoate cleavage protein [Solirubrobacterales bacterium]|nr:3-keto-5-aminohexanoate cleavage protein [Solirubrobacterales bacterium]
MPEKVIVSCAITGSVHVPAMSPYLPVTPEQIGDSAIEAAEAGAAIVHLHARDPEDGRPSPDPELYAPFVDQIHNRTDVVVNITTGGARGMSLDERLAAAVRFEPELCSLNMGSMNFAMFPVARGIEEFKHGWEQPFLEGSRSWVFQNTFEDIERIVETMKPLGTRFEFECYDLSHLYNLHHCLESGLVEPPLFIQTIFGILGGVGPEAANLTVMRETADKLFGDDYVWSVFGAGRHQTRLVTAAALQGGNVRVGLEDSIYLRRGQLARSNAEQVARIVAILSELDLEIATPDEVRQRLQLKGSAATALPS